MSNRVRRLLATAAVTATLIGAIGAGVARAQDYGDTVVTVGGGPGTVVISGGQVTNETGIGVDSGGGASIGASTGGDDSAALLQ
jgi:hypothetical protein